MWLAQPPTGWRFWAPIRIRRAHLTVRYNVPEPAAGEATLRLYDKLGREVRSVELTASSAAADRHERPFDVCSLSIGLYLLRLEVAGRAAIRKLTVLK